MMTVSCSPVRDADERESVIDFRLDVYIPSRQYAEPSSLDPLYIRCTETNEIEAVREAVQLKPKVVSKTLRDRAQRAVTIGYVAINERRQSVNSYVFGLSVTSTWIRSAIGTSRIVGSSVEPRSLLIAPKKPPVRSPVPDKMQLLRQIASGTYESTLSAK